MIHSFIQVAFSFTNDPEDLVKARITQVFGYDTSKECVSGHLSIFSFSVLGTILHMTLPVTPVYVAILLLRRGIAMRLKTEKRMSEHTRRLHQQLLNAITYQACIPIFYFFAVLTFSLGQLEVLHHPLLEFATFALVCFIPALSPMSSFYFIRPYRMWLCRKIVRMSQSVSYVNEPDGTHAGHTNDNTYESHRKPTAGPATINCSQ
ncbi:unnamed protein product [Strongylus vulgaris]|uniref:G-protein coupled receptors family 1 profile domain-containing protein n=1 Tax=Strongylus vulgaris TaxID=40348 RepID=A0A3P7IUT2_STRVU|nr:unnamed protein product [Strongylus vulgaris]